MIDPDITECPDISFLCHSNDIIQRVIESTFPVRPVAIIVYGTPASGKSQVLHDTLRRYDIEDLTCYFRSVIDSGTKPTRFDQGSFDLISRSETSYELVKDGIAKLSKSLNDPSHRASHYSDFNLVPILHDEILANIPSYRTALPEFIKKINLIQSNQLEDYSEVANQFFALYQKYRSYVYLVTSHLIDSCLATKRNLLIETTGNDLTYIQETVKKIKGNGYYVVCLYPFVRREIIYGRIIERGKSCGRIINKEIIDTCYGNCLINFFKLSIKCDEVYMFDTLRDFGSDYLLYHKRYENYQIAKEKVGNLYQVMEYFREKYFDIDLSRIRSITRRRGSFLVPETSIVMPSPIQAHETGGSNDG